MKRFVEDGIPVEIPEIECGQYLIGFLMDVGPIMAGSDGSSPVTHEEIRSWQSNVGIRLQPWEVLVLRRLSFEYQAQAQKSKDPKCPPPYGQVSRGADVADKINTIFG